MIRRAKDNGGTAVIEQTGNPSDIAARVVAADAVARKAEAVVAVESYREIIGRIADGQEPNGKMLAAIGDLCRRLHLPPDAVARSVEAIHQERLLQAQVTHTKTRLADIKSREVELAAEIKATRAKLLALDEELAEYVGLHRGYPFQAQAVAAVRGDNPVLFAPVEAVADRLVSADAAMGSDTFASLVPQPATLQGHYSSSTWGG